MSLLSRLPKSAWFIVGIMLFSINLRGPFTAAGPLVEVLRDVFGMDASAAGLLITLPLLMFCIVSPMASGWAARYGLERTLFAALLVMAAGILVRSSGHEWGLFLGTCILGAGIAVGNTLLPSVLKRDFPAQITTLTAVYALVMGVASAVASAIVIPLTNAFNWQVALGIFLLFPLVSGLVWLPQLRRQPAVSQANTSGNVKGAGVWHSALAWQVTLFMGTNSLIYYSVTAWLPSILVTLGYSPVQAGSMHGLMQLATACAGIGLVPFVRKMKDQRFIAMGMTCVCMTALLGLQLLPSQALLWVVLFGFGNSGVFILALSFIGMRAATSHQAAVLSGMAQGIGYLMAATGPILMGWLHDVFGGWTLPLSICITLCVVLGALGLGAGRNIQIGQGKSAAG